MVGLLRRGSEGRRWTHFSPVEVPVTPDLSALFNTPVENSVGKRESTLISSLIRVLSTLCTTRGASLKVRLDKLLLERGVTTSRERAQALILAGKGLVNGQKVEKAGAGVEGSADIRRLGEDLKYVGRAGLNIEAALKHCQLHGMGKLCADV